MHIRQLYLETVDLPSVRQFYGETLHLSTSETPDGTLAVAVGETTVYFSQGEEPQRYHLAFNIPHNQFRAAKAWLKGRVPLLPTVNNQDEIDFPAWNAKSLYFLDPVGNVLEFIARFGLPNAREGEFDERGFLSVSEVGLGVPDVQQAARELQEHFDLRVFDGEGNETFCAVGDDHGLFIVVKAGREWFPSTGVLAGLCPLTVVIEPLHPVEKLADVAHVLSGTPYRVIIA